MNKTEIQSIIENGENSFVEFKEVSVSPNTLAEELVAFLNIKGGSIFIGISDDGEVKGIDIDRKSNLEESIMNVCRNNIVPPIIPQYELIKIETKWIAGIMVAEGIEKPYSTIQGKHFVRTGSTKRIASRQELLRLHQNSMVLHIDDRPIRQAGIETLDMEKVKAFFLNVYDIDFKDINKIEEDRILINSCILAPINSGLSLTLTGILFFSQKKDMLFSSLEQYLPHAGIQFIAYENEDLESILDRFDCFEPYPEAIDSIVHKIRLNWKTPSKINGLKRQETGFPEKLFRELVVNAVAHRDYSIPSKIQIRLLPDRIEVITPGRLVNSVTIEKMKTGISIPRNPLIIKYMQNFKYSDQLGRGIPMVLKKVQSMPGYEIEFKEKEDRFLAILKIP